MALRGRVSIAAAVFSGAVFLGATTAAFGVCGPFTDISDVAFCPFVLEIFTLGIGASLPWPVTTVAAGFRSARRMGPTKSRLDFSRRHCGQDTNCAKGARLISIQSNKCAVGGFSGTGRSRPRADACHPEDGRAIQVFGFPSG